LYHFAIGDNGPDVLHRDSALEHAFQRMDAEDELPGWGQLTSPRQCRFVLRPLFLTPSSSFLFPSAKRVDQK
jgi:hypothetical protein